MIDAKDKSLEEFFKKIIEIVKNVKNEKHLQNGTQIPTLKGKAFNSYVEF